MSQQQPPDPMAPLPAMTGFTVTDGFSVIPPKRPTAVTAASVLLFVIAGLSFVGAFAFVITDLLHTTVIFEVVTHQGFWHGLLLFAVAAATAVFAMLVRNASSGATIATFTVLGGAAILFLGAAVGDLAEAPFVEAGDTQGSVLLLALMLLLGVGLAAAPVVLLASPAAARWFRQRRREVTFVDAPAAVSRPAAFILAIAFVTLTGLLELANIAVNAGWMSSQDVDFIGSEGVLVHYFVSVGVPVLLILAVTVGLPFAGDTARIAAYGVCGYYCFNGVSSLAGFVFINDSTVGFNWVYYLDLALSVITAVTAGVALFGLSRKRLVQWYDGGHEPPESGPTPVPPAPAPSGQE